MINFIWLPLAAGIVIETLQFLLSLLVGYLDRVIDINDVMMNALGVWLGYSLLRLFAALFLKITSRLVIKPNGLLAYIHAAVSRA